MKKEDLTMVSYDTWGSIANTGLIASELEVGLDVINGIIDSLLKGDMSKLVDISVSSSVVVDENNREHPAYEINEAMSIYLFQDIINVSTRKEVLDRLLKEFAFAEAEVGKLQSAENAQQEYLHELEVNRRELARAVRHSLIAYDNMGRIHDMNINVNKEMVMSLELTLKLARELSENILMKGEK